MITNRRRLLFSENTRSRFFDADERIVYLKDNQFKYVYVNQSFERFHEICSADVIGLSDHDLFDPAFAEECRRTDADTLAKMSTITDQVQWQGHLFKTIKFPVPLLNGCIGVGALVSDITEMTLYKKQLEKTLQRNIILMNVLNENFDSTQQQLDYVLNEAIALTESQYGYIYLYDEASQIFSLNSWSLNVMPDCCITQKDTKYMLDKTGLWGEVVRQKAPIIINDFNMPNPLKKGYPAGHVALERFMSIPVFRDGKIVAVAGVANKKENYETRDVDQLSALMNGTWIAKEKREAQIQLSVERSKYLQTLISIGDGVLVVDNNGHIEMLNNVAEILTGWTMDQAIGKHYTEVFALSHEIPDRRIEDPIQEVLQRDSKHEMSAHAILTSKNGIRYNIEDSAAPIHDSGGDLSGVVLVFRDVTEKREQQSKIEYLSFHDSLTGLKNRRYCEEELKHLDIPEKLPFSILMGDLNGLKLANDIFGHHFGDVLLKRAADTLSAFARPGDIVARWGGDEFIMLLPETTSETAADLVNSIRDMFIQRRTKSIKGTLSLGCDTKLTPDQSIYTVMETAENRMYAQKTLQQREEKGGLIQTIVDLYHGNYPEEEIHSRRVCELSIKVGTVLALSNTELYRLREAVHLHDIGKVSIAAALLKKKSGYTEEELQIIYQHPATGYRLLSYYDKTLELAGIVLAHHEHWDGSGYPNGISGEEIPLLAQIICVVEGYQQKLDEFPDDVAKGQQNAITYVKTHAGSLYDPRIADALTDAVMQVK